MQHFRGCQRRLFVGKWSESGRPGADSGVGGDPCVPNGKSPKLGLCSLAGGLPVRPLAIRCGVCAGHLPFDTPRGQGAPSTTRCIKTCNRGPNRCSHTASQGAPSTTRCIKTAVSRLMLTTLFVVREHPAPSGALRRGSDVGRCLRPLLQSGSTQHHQVH